MGRQRPRRPRRCRPAQQGMRNQSTPRPALTASTRLPNSTAAACTPSTCSHANRPPAEGMQTSARLMRSELALDDLALGWHAVGLARTPRSDMLRPTAAQKPGWAPARHAPCAPSAHLRAWLHTHARRLSRPQKRCMPPRCTPAHRWNFIPAQVTHSLLLLGGGAPCGFQLRRAHVCRRCGLRGARVHAATGASAYDACGHADAA